MCARTRQRDRERENGNEPNRVFIYICLCVRKFVYSNTFVFIILACFPFSILHLFSFRVLKRCSKLYSIHQIFDWSGWFSISRGFGCVCVCVSFFVHVYLVRTRLRFELLGLNYRLTTTNNNKIELHFLHTDFAINTQLPKKAFSVQCRPMLYIFPFFSDVCLFYVVVLMIFTFDLHKVYGKTCGNFVQKTETKKNRRKRSTLFIKYTSQQLCAVT